jgi:hypothetical protein
MELTVLKCPSCAAALDADAIDSARSFATCRHCKSLISLTRPGTPSPMPGPRQPVPLPEKFKLSSSGSSLRIEWRWWSPAYIFLFLFCIAWDSFLFFWYSMALGGPAPVFFMLFPIVHVAVGVGLTYLCLAGFFNRTVVKVDNRVLRVRHGPLPWPGNVDWSVNDLRQFFVRSQTHRGKHGSNETFDVVAVPAEGRRRPLLKRLPSQDQAIFVEQELERFLSIQDEPVPGEISRQ